MNENTNVKNDNSILKLIISLIILVVCSVAVAVIAGYVHIEPSGDDVWAHIYKSQFTYDNMIRGNFYPLYVNSWYNGIQPYRYWPPLAYYIMAVLQIIAGGDLHQAYYIFMGVMFLTGAIPFVLIGYNHKRTFWGLMIGILWFVFPENIRVFFVEGNLPRIVTDVLVPYVVYFLWLYIRKEKRSALIGLALTMTLMTFTHLMITAMVGIGTFLYLLVDYINTKRWKTSVNALVFMVVGILIAGIWFVPALFGGVLGDGAAGGSTLYFEKLSDSLNVANRFVGNSGVYYYGLSILLVAIFGVVLARNNKKTGFVYSIIVLLMTTPAFMVVTEHIPLGSLLWMTRFTALVYAFFCLALLEWTTIKNRYLIAVMAAIVADCLIGVCMIPDYYTPPKADVIYDTDYIKPYISQRVSNMDLSLYESYPSWAFAVDGDTGYTYGWSRGASTEDNVILLNEALEFGQYNYVFDRCIELGNDAVLVRKNIIIREKELLEAAEKNGFEYLGESSSAYFFKKNTPEHFGVKSTYEGLAIGSYTGMFTEYYPLFEKGASNYIDDYSVEELTQYKSIFLSGFEYNSKAEAEKLINEVSAAGTRVVLDIAHLPGNALKQPYFLGISAYTISFSKHMPNLHYKDEIIISGDFNSEDADWKTSYANNYDTILGYIVDGGREIPFMGYDTSNPNLYYVGLNIVYFSQGLDRSDMWDMLDDCFAVSHKNTPVRELVPLDIEISDRKIVIHSDETGVNTTLGFQDNFRSAQNIYEHNNLLHIGEKDVVIDLIYPYFGAAVIVSVVGVILLIALYIITLKKVKLAQKSAT